MMRRPECTNMIHCYDCMMYVPAMRYYVLLFRPLSHGNLFDANYSEGAGS